MRRTLAAAVMTTAALALAPAAHAHPASPPRPATLAVIGDIPYGTPLIGEFPSDISEINADPNVSRVIHLGDIKNGSTRCDTSYFQQIRGDFDGFADPLVYTPGDNEWTDCHRASNGAYVPAGPTPAGQADTLFATLNVPGSNNDFLPWFDTAETDAQKAAQQDEVAGRTPADVDWIDQAFRAARHEHAAAVAVGIQADMWDPAIVAAGPSQYSAFTPIVQELARQAARFRKPVLLLNGDSHLFESDRPLVDPHATTSLMYGVVQPVPNLVRVTVQGSTNVPHEWLRLHVDPRSADVFSWENVAF